MKISEHARHELALPVLLGSLLALTRIWALTGTPWEWDEALFLSAMRDYDLSIHHPHPPGYPLESPDPSCAER